jgi:hypothetical protein
MLDVSFRGLHKGVNKGSLDASDRTAILSEEVEDDRSQGSHSAEEEEDLYLSDPPEHDDETNASTILTRTSQSLQNADAAATEHSSSASLNHRVQFSTVEIREYARTASDNPAVSCGIPVGLDWVVVAYHKGVPVDDYETIREGRSQRSASELRMTSMEREGVLRVHCGYSRAELKDLAYRVNIARKQREATVSSLRSSIGQRLFFKRLLPRKVLPPSA